MYVGVYADGPTRVLRFSDDKNVSSAEAQDAVLDLAARLKQVETQLRDVNARFARLNGLSGAHVLDLYGRTSERQEALSARASALARKPTRNQGMSRSAKALVRQAHSRLLLGGGSVDGGSPGPLARLAGGGSAGGSVAGSMPASRVPSLTPSRLSLDGRPGAASLADPATAPRQATVRFDVPSSPGRGAGVAPPGVLHVPPSLDEREERLLPYR